MAVLKIMQPNETVEAAPSAENGNIPVDAPSEPTPAPVVPTETPTEPAKPAETVQELYELPDGRKVDGHTVAQEYKNLLSDYTRKSQELASVKTKPETITTKPSEVDPYDDPNYVPKTYGEVIKVAEQRALKSIQAEREAEVAKEKALETQVSSQVQELKKTDPSLNENALFAHATKYRFNDLKVAYQNMKDMNLLVKNVQQVTAKNIAKRADPVSTTQAQPSGNLPDRTMYSSARDYFRSLSK